MDMLAALSLQIAWGADEALDVLPLDRTLASVSVALSGRSPMQTAPSPRMSPVLAAELCAEAATTIEELRAALLSFSICPLAATATNLVFADGSPGAGVVVVDDTPGSAEDLSGRPMSGPAGQLLDRMLGSIGLDRSTVLITNLVPWRPPGGRLAAEAEVAVCLPFLRRHLALLRPRFVVSLGSAPAQALSGSEAPIRRLRGKWQKISLADVREPIALLPMLHPEALLRTPAAKKEAWADMLALQRGLKGALFKT